MLLSDAAREASQPQLAKGALTPKQRFKQLSTPQLKAFMGKPALQSGVPQLCKTDDRVLVAAHRFSPALDLPVYPGHARNASYDFAHQLTQLIRGFLLVYMRFAQGDPPNEILLECLSESIDECAGRNAATLEVPPPKGVRLFAPKIVAVPDELSAGEYWALAVPLSRAYVKLEDYVGELPVLRPLETIVECQLQAIACPELLKYTGKK